jgi:hypothetical protein
MSEEEDKDEEKYLLSPEDVLDLIDKHLQVEIVQEKKKIKEINKSCKTCEFYDHDINNDLHFCKKVGEYFMIDEGSRTYCPFYEKQA